MEKGTKKTALNSVVSSPTHSYSLNIALSVQWNLCIVVTLGPTFCGCIIEGGCIIEVRNTLAICTLGPNQVALLERLAAIE